MIISGINSVTEALRARGVVKAVYMSDKFSHPSKDELVEQCKAAGIGVEYVSVIELDRMIETKNTQGIVAKVKDFQYVEIDQLLRKEHPFIVLLDGIEDPHNLGSIIRTCECAGVDGIIIPKHRAASINETVYRTSAGAVSNVSIACVTNIHDAIRHLKAQNIWVYALEAEGTDIYKTDLTGSLAIVVGGEGAGVSALSKRLADGIVSLPMKGRTNSLNASNACAIAVYEAVRQRKY